MQYDQARVDAIRGTIIGCAIEVHRHLGPGLLESVLRTLRVDRDCAVPIVYRGQKIGSPLLIDLLVEDLVVVEVKAVEHLIGVHTAQVITYLKLAEKPAGLLLNFNSVLMKDGTRRISHPDILPKIVRARSVPKL